MIIAILLISAGKYSFGRISLSLLHEVLPEMLLKSSKEKENGNERADTEYIDDNHKNRRLCCICGPIPFVLLVNNVI